MITKTETALWRKARTYGIVGLALVGYASGIATGVALSGTISAIAMGLVTSAAAVLFFGMFTAQMKAMAVGIAVMDASAERYITAGRELDMRIAMAERQELSPVREVH